jgi:hypothetical protein
MLIFVHEWKQAVDKDAEVPMDASSWMSRDEERPNAARLEPQGRMNAV